MRFKLALATLVLAGVAQLCAGTGAFERYRIKYGHPPPDPKGELFLFEARWNSRCEQLFEKIDRNHDGLISETEWRKAQRFFLRIDEGTEARELRHEYRFNVLDSNHDGVIQLEEWTRHLGHTVDVSSL